MRVILILLAAASCCIAGAPATRPCPYPTAHDKPLNVESALVKAEAGYSLYRVEFNGVKDGSRVPANLYLPSDKLFKAPYPAVLLQYGSGGNKNTNYIVAIAQVAVARGLAVLTIDAPNRGERKGKDDRISFMDTNFLQHLGDYSRATDYLASRKDVDARRMGYVGISWGAITGVTYCAHDPRMAVVCSLVGGGNFAGMIPGAVPEEIRQKTESYDPYYHVKLIAPRPLLLMNVTHDQLVPKFLADSLHQAAPQGATKVWLDADHFFNGVDREKTAGRVMDFLLKNLPTPG